MSEVNSQQPINSVATLVEKYTEGKRDFSRAELGNADLQGINLRGADLSYADLSEANLRGANLPLLRCTNRVLVGSLILTLCSYLVNPKIKRKHDFLLSDFNWCKAETLINTLEKTSP